MKYFRILPSILLVPVVLSSACSSDVAELDPAELPSFMRVEEGAYEIKAWQQADSSTWLSYRLNVPFAAEEPISSFSERLRAAGFHEVPFHWTDSAIPSSRAEGWSTWNHELGGSIIGVHDWQVSWVGTDGSMVLYELQYRGEPQQGSQFMPPANDTLEVTVTSWPGFVTLQRCPHVLEWRDGLPSES